MTSKASPLASKNSNNYYSGLMQNIDLQDIDGQKMEREEVEKAQQEQKIRARFGTQTIPDHHASKPLDLSALQQKILAMQVPEVPSLAGRIDTKPTSPSNSRPGLSPRSRLAGVVKRFSPPDSSVSSSVPLSPRDQTPLPSLDYQIVSTKTPSSHNRDSRNSKEAPSAPLSSTVSVVSPREKTSPHKLPQVPLSPRHPVTPSSHSKEGSHPRSKPLPYPVHSQSSDSGLRHNTPTPRHQRTSQASSSPVHPPFLGVGPRAASYPVLPSVNKANGSDETDTSEKDTSSSDGEAKDYKFRRTPKWSAIDQGISQLGEDISSDSSSDSEESDDKFRQAPKRSSSHKISSSETSLGGAKISPSLIDLNYADLNELSAFQTPKRNLKAEGAESDGDRWLPFSTGEGKVIDSNYEFRSFQQPRRYPKATHDHGSAISTRVDLFAVKSEGGHSKKRVQRSSSVIVPEVEPSEEMMRSPPVSAREMHSDPKKDSRIGRSLTDEPQYYDVHKVTREASVETIQEQCKFLEDLKHFACNVGKKEALLRHCLNCFPGREHVIINYLLEFRSKLTGNKHINRFNEMMALALHRENNEAFIFAYIQHKNVEIDVFADEMMTIFSKKKILFSKMPSIIERITKYELKWEHPSTAFRGKTLSSHLCRAYGNIFWEKALKKIHSTIQNLFKETPPALLCLERSALTKVLLDEDKEFKNRDKILQDSKLKQLYDENLPRFKSFASIMLSNIFCMNVPSELNKVLSTRKKLIEVFLAANPSEKSLNSPNTLISEVITLRMIIPKLLKIKDPEGAETVMLSVAKLLQCLAKEAPFGDEKDDSAHEPLNDIYESSIKDYGEFIKRLTTPLSK